MIWQITSFKNLFLSHQTPHCFSLPACLMQCLSFAIWWCLHSMSHWYVAINRRQFNLQVCHSAKQNCVRNIHWVEVIASSNYNRFSACNGVVSLFLIDTHEHAWTYLSLCTWYFINYFMRNAWFNLEECRAVSCERHITANPAKRKLQQCIQVSPQPCAQSASGGWGVGKVDVTGLD